MSSVNKRTIRQYHLIQHTLGAGSRMSQDRYGDSFLKPPSPKSQSDVFGKQASSQGFRLSKPGE